MCNYTISFDRPWMFAFILVAAFLVFFPYFKTPKNKRRRLGRIAALVTRMLIVCVALFQLAGVTFTETSLVPEDTSLVVVVDRSESTKEVDEQIDDYVEELLNGADATTKTAVVIFAGNAVSATDFSLDHKQTFDTYITTSTRELEKDATNISDALKAAWKMFPQEGRDNKRVILISDGRQTSGNAWDAAEMLISDGIRLDAVSFNVTSGDYAEAALTDFSITPSQVIDHGKNITMKVTVQSTVETEGYLKFYDGDTLITKYSIALNKGKNYFDQVYSGNKLDTAGLHQLRVEMEPIDDSLEQNNYLYTWVKVNGDAKLLIVDGDGSQGQTLANLVNTTYETDVIRPYEFPATMEELLEYDQIVLMNVLAGNLPDGADVLINRFVTNLGRGLFTTTGDNVDSYNSYANTALEEMLPVNMTLDETTNNVAMVLVIDDSGSMLDANAALDKFHAALAGAVRCIETLGENDYIGIVTFHAESTVQQQLIKPTDKDALIQLVNSLTANNYGTSYGEGLSAAYDLLRDFNGARSKHVVFISDGEPTDSNYATLPSTLKNHGISLTTIGMMATDRAKDLLSSMADQGGGQSYVIDTQEDLETLAQLMEDLTVQAKEPQFINTDPFSPEAGGDDTGVLAGVDLTNITMGGYIGSTLKTDALMPAYADDFRPIIAEWDWGRGHVCTFMTDIAGAWCEELLTGDNGKQLISNLAAQALNEEIQSTGLQAEITQSDETANIRVQSAYDAFGLSVEMKVTNGSEEQDVHLIKSGTATYRGSFSTPDPNRLYYLEITLTDSDGAVQDRMRIAYSGGVIGEYDLFGNDGDTLLNSISALTGGEVMREVAALYAVKLPDSIEFRTNGLLPCAIAMAVLLLVDIFARTVTVIKKPKKK